MISKLRNDKTIQLHHGRTLGYEESALSQGKALFYFPGHPDCRFEARFLANPAAEHRVRLIGIDRPGMGLSTVQLEVHLLPTFLSARRPIIHVKPIPPSLSIIQKRL